MPRASPSSPGGTTAPSRSTWRWPPASRRRTPSTMSSTRTRASNRSTSKSPSSEDEELAIIKRLLQYPEVVRGAGRALEPHRVAYWLQELAGMFHPYYKNHRVIQDDRQLMLARLALCAGVGRVIRNGLELLGVSAPESM